MAREHDAVDLRPVKAFGRISRPFECPGLVAVFFLHEEAVLRHMLPVEEGLHHFLRHVGGAEAVTLLLHPVAVSIECFFVPGSRDGRFRFQPVLPLQVILVEQGGDVGFPGLGRDLRYFIGDRGRIVFIRKGSYNT